MSQAQGLPRERAWETGAVVSELTNAIRRLGTTRWASTAAILTLATGIGLASTMFLLVDSLLWRPPAAVTAPQELRRLYFSRVRPGEPVTWADVAPYLFQSRLAESSSPFSQYGVFVGEEVPAGRGANAAMMRAVFASGGLWSALQTRPSLGRFFGADEANPGSDAPVVVLSHHVWQQKFGGSADVIGQRLDIRGKPFTVIGVAPPGFRGVDLVRTDLWLPLSTYRRDVAVWNHPDLSPFVHFVGRLRPGVTAAAADARLTDAYRSAFRTRLRNPSAAGVLTGAVTGGVGNNREPLPAARVASLLLRVAIMLLIIAGANTAIFLFIRALRREPEVAMRVALGITPGRLALHLMAEATVLAVVAAAVATLTMLWAPPLIGRLLFPEMAWNHGDALRGAVIITGVAGTIVAGLVAGLPSALFLWRNTIGVLRSAVQSRSRHGYGTQRVLIAFQTALSVLLLVFAALFTTSLVNARRVDIGLDPNNVLAVSVRFSPGERPGEEIRALYERAAERFRGLPGVKSVALAVNTPLVVARGGSVRIPGRDSLPETAEGGPTMNYVTPEFFSTMGMSIVAGRGFLSTERQSTNILVVNQTMARLYWPGETALGRCVQFRGSDDCATVIGVVRNARKFRLKEAESIQYFRPLAPTLSDGRVLLMRIAPGVGVTPQTVRSMFHELMPALPYIDVKPVVAELDRQVQPWRLGATLLSVFGLVALVLVFIGLFNTTAYGVQSRVRELGIRTAMGASPRRIVGSVLREGILPALVGTAVGGVLALFAAGFIRDQLFDVSPYNSFIHAGVGILLLAVSALAMLIPALRAGRIPPASALRTF